MLTAFHKQQRSVSHGPQPLIAAYPTEKALKSLTCETWSFNKNNLGLRHVAEMSGNTSWGSIHSTWRKRIKICIPQIIWPTLVWRLFSTLYFPLLLFFLKQERKGINLFTFWSALPEPSAPFTLLPCRDLSHAGAAGGLRAPRGYFQSSALTHLLVHQPLKKHPCALNSV